MSDKMEKISALALDQYKAEQEVERIEGDLAKAKARLKDVAEKQIPEFMDDIGLEKVECSNGLIVMVKETIRANLSADRREEGLKWIRDHGCEHLITSEVTVKPETDQIALDLVNQLKDHHPVAKQTVNGNTLSKWVRERLAEGETVDFKLFGVFRQRVSKVKTA